MGILYNDIEVKKVIFNDREVEEMVYKGTTVFSAHNSYIWWPFATWDDDRYNMFLYRFDYQNLNEEGFVRKGDHAQKDEFYYTYLEAGIDLFEGGIGPDEVGSYPDSRGLCGLVHDVGMMLPLDEFGSLYDEWMQTSPDFASGVNCGDEMNEFCSLMPMQAILEFIINYLSSDAEVEEILTKFGYFLLPYKIRLSNGDYEYLSLEYGVSGYTYSSKFSSGNEKKLIVRLFRTAFNHPEGVISNVAIVDTGGNVEKTYDFMLERDSDEIIFWND